MQPEALSLGDAAQFADRIDHAERKVGRRADEHERLVVDHGLDRGEVHAKIRPDRRPTDLEIHQLRAFVESGMQCLRADDIAAQSWLVSPGARKIAASLDRLEDAFGAPARHEAPRVVRRMKQPERHLDDLGLHPLHTWKRAPGAERVFAEKLEKRRAPDFVGRIVDPEDEQRRAPMLPIDIVLFHLPHLRENVVGATTGLGENGSGWHLSRSPSGTMQRG